MLLKRLYGKETIAYCLVIAFGLVLIFHFTLLWIGGGIFIHEQNKIILALETIMSISIIGFGIERLISTSGRKDNAIAGRRHSMLPKCLCGKEMKFVMNNRWYQIYECTCSRLMMRPQREDIRRYYTPDGIECAGDIVDTATITIGITP